MDQSEVLFTNCMLVNFSVELVNFETNFANCGTKFGTFWQKFCEIDCKCCCTFVLVDVGFKNVYF